MLDPKGLHKLKEKWFKSANSKKLRTNKLKLEEYISNCERDHLLEENPQNYQGKNWLPIFLCISIKYRFLLKRRHPIFKHSIWQGIRRIWGVKQFRLDYLAAHYSSNLYKTKKYLSIVFFWTFLTSTDKEAYAWLPLGVTLHSATHFMQQQI